MAVACILPPCLVPQNCTVVLGGAVSPVLFYICGSTWHWSRIVEWPHAAVDVAKLVGIEGDAAGGSAGRARPRKGGIAGESDPDYEVTAALSIHSPHAAPRVWSLHAYMRMAQHGRLNGDFASCPNVAFLAMPQLQQQASAFQRLPAWVAVPVRGACGASSGAARQASGRALCPCASCSLRGGRPCAAYRAYSPPSPLRAPAVSPGLPRCTQCSSRWQLRPVWHLCSTCTMVPTRHRPIGLPAAQDACRGLRCR